MKVACIGVAPAGTREIARWITLIGTNCERRRRSYICSVQLDLMPNWVKFGGFVVLYACVRDLLSAASVPAAKRKSRGSAAPDHSVAASGRNSWDSGLAL